MNNPNCFKCKHFFITYDKNAPRGCRLYQIKSKELPSVIVKLAGSPCAAFEEKKKDIKEKKLDLNDPKFW